jgi:hypothetical protein
MNDVHGFFGEYRFLSNFYPSPIEVNGKKYETVEHYYQAMKATNEEDHEYVRSSPSPGIAKHRGKRILIRSDWEMNKVSVMLEGLIAKFEQNQLLLDKLIETDTGELIEVNSWGDTFWGRHGNIGQNNLGKLLMFVRSTF